MANFTELQSLYSDSNMSQEQLIIMSCILDGMNPELKIELRTKGRTIQLNELDGNSIYDVIEKHYPSANRQALSILANLRQPSTTTAVGPGEMLTVMFVDGARFTARCEASDLMIGDAQIEMKGQQCRICSQNVRFDAVAMYNLTKKYAEKFNIKLRDDHPNASIQGMSNFLEQMLGDNSSGLTDYLLELGEIIYPGIDYLDLCDWASSTRFRLTDCPRTEEIPDPRMIGRGKNRRYDENHVRVRKIVASKSIGPVFIQCQGELCFLRYARSENFGAMMTFDKETGRVRIIDPTNISINTLDQRLREKIKFICGPRTGPQDNGPQAVIL